MPLSLALVRAHLSLDDDRDPDLLTHYCNVAEAWVQAYTGLPFDAGDTMMAQAALLMAAHQYEARGAVPFASAYQPAFGVHDLLSPLKTRVTGYQPAPEAV